MVFLHPEIQDDKNKAQYIKNKLEYTLLQDVDVGIVLYDPKQVDGITTIPEDQGILDMYSLFTKLDNPDTEQEVKDNNPWIIRFQFDREFMMESGLVMEDIHGFVRVGQQVG